MAIKFGLETLFEVTLLAALFCGSGKYLKDHYEHSQEYKANIMDQVEDENCYAKDLEIRKKMKDSSNKCLGFFALGIGYSGFLVYRHTRKSNPRFTPDFPHLHKKTDRILTLNPPTDYRLSQQSEGRRYFPNHSK